MSWNRVIGQKRAKEVLRRALEKKQVAHAYLFFGDEGTGKDALAIEFARALNCELGGADACGKCDSCRKVDGLRHPNIKLIIALPVGKGEKTGDDPIKGLSEEQLQTLQEEIGLKAKDPYHKIEVSKANFIKVNSIREIRREASLSGFESGRKIFIVSEADTMNREASNSLLKTLEEPPSNTILILTSSRKDQLPPTIVSRCQVLRCEPLSDTEIAEALVERDGIEMQEASMTARLANGSYLFARSLISEDISKMRSEVIQFLRVALVNSPTTLVNEVETVLGRIERPGAERWLRLLQVWFHDALELREGASRSNGHGNYSDDLERFVERFGHTDLLTAANTVDRSIALLGKNVYLPLVFLTLAIELNDILTAERYLDRTS